MSWRSREPTIAQSRADIARISRVRYVDLDVAGVHVGMEKVVVKYLGEKSFHTLVRQYLEVDVGCAQSFYVTYRYAIYALHNQ